MTRVSLRSLTRRFDSTVAVDAIDLDVGSGELVALLGPSGCGKTTTLRMIAGLLDPTGGSIEFDGKPVVSVPTEKRGAVMVFQKHLLFPTMTVGQNVGFGLKMARLSGTEIAATVDEMLERVQLGGFGDRRAHELSGGQQQRVALARALAVRPKVLLLDEPLASLDANLRKDMRSQIQTIQRDLGITTLMVTHDQDDAIMLADRVALMDAGRILQYGHVADFYDRPTSSAVAAFFGNGNCLDGTARVDSVQTTAGTFHHEVDTSHAATTSGAVHLTVRPEAIEIATSPGTNTVVTRVLSATYRGTYVEVELDMAGTTWTMHARPSDRVTVGEPLLVRLPPEAVWVYP